MPPAEPRRRPTSVTEALDLMLVNVTLPTEAAPSVALAYTTAALIDNGNGEGREGFAPLANTMVKQLAALREWIEPPDPTEEDPFDALARRLGAQVDSSGD